METRDIVNEFADSIVDKQSREGSKAPYAYAAGYLSSTIVELIDMLPKSKRKAYLEILASVTERNNNG